jgi:hypothetical protein
MIMEPLNSFHKNRFWILWTLSTGLGWLFTFPGLVFRNEDITAWNSIPKIGWDMFVGSLILGGIVGTLQVFLLRFDMKIKYPWILIQAFSYGVGISLAFLLSAYSVAFQFPEVVSTNGNSFMMMPLEYTAFVAGGIIGAIQSFAIKLPNISRRARALYVLGSFVSWSIGVFSTGYAWNAGFPINIQSAVGGLVIGAMTGGFLLLSFPKPSTQVIPGKITA